MPRTQTSFLTDMLFAITAPLFMVIATAVVAIPYSLGGHPGEGGFVGASDTAYHLS